MPTLPVHNSTANIEAKPAAPLRQEAAQSFQDDQGVLKTLGNVAQQWSDANDVMQYTEAKAKHGIGLLDIQSRAAADPDFKNRDKYAAEIADLSKTSADGISNQQVAGKANVEFNYDAQVADLKIGSQFKEKQIAYNQVQVKTNLDLLMQNKLAAQTPQEAQLYQDKIEGLLHDNVTTGVLDYKMADKMLQESQKTSVQYDIYADPSTSEKDSKTLAELRDPKGKYSFLPPDTRLDLITESQRRIFQNNQTFKKEVDASQVVRNDDFISKIADQTATFKDLDNEQRIPEEQGGIPRKTLLQYQNYLQRGVDKTLNEYLKEKNPAGDQTHRSKLAAQYNTLIETYLDDKTDQWKAKEALAKGLADGALDADELKVLSPLKDNLNDIKFNKDTSIFASAIKSVKTMLHASNEPSDVIALKTKQLLNSIGNGTQPQVAASQIMDSQMLKYFPDYQTYPKQGKKKIDNKTRRAYIVYPDGKWNWADGGQ